MTGALGPHPPGDALAAEALTPEVEAHLRGCPPCRIQRRLLLAAVAPPEEVPGLSEARATMSASREASIASLGLEIEPVRNGLARGARIGPWQVEARIGAGGVAVVYRVRHIGHGTVAALKVVDGSSDGLQRRVAREAAAQRTLVHPNVVPVLDVLEVAGRPALLLELVPGPTLADVLAADVLALGPRLGLGLDVLEGVAAAHARDLVHRDLKPSNVLVDPSDGRLVARVADFGLVKIDPADASRLTRTGAVLGTPAYMAPEQIRDSGAIDARADVFSLGAVLFELVTGTRAFRGATLIEVFDRIRSGARPAVRDQVPDLPEALVRAIDGALEPDRDKRLPTVEAVRALWVEGCAGSATEADDRAVDAVTALVGDRPVHHRASTWHGPGSASALLGRDDLLSRVAARLHRPGWTTLVGPPGAGSTALALEASSQAAPYLSGGVVHVRAAGATTADAIVDAVLAALGLPLRSSADLPASLAAHGALLLVLDRVSPEALGRHREGWRLPELRVLATAHEPLGVAQEEVVAVPPITRAAARLLWAETARSTGDDERIERILDACGGLPVAVRIAAACGPALQALSGPLGPLEGCARAVRCALTPDAARAWDLATVFRGGFTAQALAAVLDADEVDAEDHLDELVEMGVVLSAGTAGAPRFWLVDAVRPAPAPSEAFDRLVAWCGALDPTQAVTERGNLAVAVERARSNGDRSAVVRCGGRLLAAIWDAGTESAARALAGRLDLPLPDRDGPRRSRLATLRAQALAAMASGAVRSARPHAAAAVREARLRALPDEEAAARALLVQIDREIRPAS